MIQNINRNGSTVSADLHGFMYSAVYGYSGVLDIGSKMEASVVSNNEIKITDGLLCNHGRFMRIVGSESITIKNGTSGIKRTDLIVAHFETDGVNETHDIRVITGESGGATPSYAADDIYDDGTACDLPLYTVKLNGLNIESVEKMFVIIYSIGTLRSNISNPNMLINSDFRHPVNQRGASSYTGNSIYTIDRWMISNNETLTVEDGYVRFKHDKAQSYLLLQQKVEMDKTSVPDVMTLSFKARSSQKSKMEIYDTKRYYEIGTEWSVISITFTKDEIGPSLFDDHFRVYIGVKDYTNPSVDNLPSGAYVDIEWAKLEAGSIATKFVPRLYVEELLLCQRFSRVLEEIRLYRQTYSSGKLYFRYELSLPMRSTPTVNLLSGSIKLYRASDWGTIKDVGDISNIDTERTNKYIDFIVPNSSDIESVININGKILINAEIY